VHRRHIANLFHFAGCILNAFEPEASLGILILHRPHDDESAFRIPE